MDEFLVVIGELFIIIMIQTVMEAFVSDKRKLPMYRIVSLACYFGSLAVVIHFVSTYLMREIQMILRYMP